MGQLKVLVIGANGFVGSNLVKGLGNKYKVKTVSRSDNIDFANLDSVQSLLEQIKPNVVINCLTYGQKQVNSAGPTVEVAKNMAMFYNFVILSDYFDQYINIGSGAEFDRSLNINCVKEHDVNNFLPQDSYGFAKNLIARAIQTMDSKFYTLRLFGCFGPNELSTRLLPKFLNSNEFKFEDRWFDYISADDFVRTVKFVIDQQPYLKDINCVYSEKLLLSQILEKFCDIHDIDKKFIATGQSQFDYTGDSVRLNYYKNQIKIKGLEQGLRDYL